MTINPKRQRRTGPPQTLLRPNVSLHPSYLYEGQELRRLGIGGVEVKRFEARQRPRLWANNPTVVSPKKKAAVTKRKASLPHQSSRSVSRRVKKMAKALPTRATKTACTYNNKRKRTDISNLSVTFSEPLVTKVWSRPFTPSEDKAALFYSKGDIARFRQEYNKWQVWSEDDSDEDYYSSDEDEDEYECDETTRDDDNGMFDDYEEEDVDDDLDASLDSLTSEDSLSSDSDEDYPSPQLANKKNVTMFTTTAAASASVVPRDISASRLPLYRDSPDAAHASFGAPAQCIARGGI